MIPARARTVRGDLRRLLHRDPPVRGAPPGRADRRDERRKLRALERVDREVTDDQTDSLATRLAAEGLRGPLARAVAGLPAGQRDALLLVVLGELSYDEVAAALDVPFGTVSSRINRARKKLRKALGGANPLQDDQENR